LKKDVTSCGARWLLLTENVAMGTDVPSNVLREKLFLHIG